MISPYWMCVVVSPFRLLNQFVSFHEICYEFMTLEGTTKVLSNFLQQFLIQSGSTNFIEVGAVLALTLAVTLVFNLQLLPRL